MVFAFLAVLPMPSRRVTYTRVLPPLVHVHVYCISRRQPQASYPFLAIFPELNREMLAANARIDTPHHWQSRWHQWLYNGRGVSYYTKEVEGGKMAAVYLLGNPIVVWGCGIAVIAAVVSIAWGLKVRTR